MKMIFAATLGFRDKVFATRASDSQRTQERESEDLILSLIPSQTAEENVK